MVWVEIPSSWSLQLSVVHTQRNKEIHIKIQISAMKEMKTEYVAENNVKEMLESLQRGGSREFSSRKCQLSLD